MSDAKQHIVGLSYYQHLGPRWECKWPDSGVDGVQGKFEILYNRTQECVQKTQLPELLKFEWFPYKTWVTGVLRKLNKGIETHDMALTVVRAPPHSPTPHTPTNPGTHVSHHASDHATCDVHR